MFDEYLQIVLEEIDELQKYVELLDDDQRITFLDEDRSSGDFDEDFFKRNVEPIFNKLLKKGFKLRYYHYAKEKWDKSYNVFYYIELDKVKPHLTAKRIRRGYAKSGRSHGLMRSKVAQQKAVGQKLDNTYWYGDKDRKLRPKQLGYDDDLFKSLK